MKNNGLMQVTIEVGRCIIPRLPYAEYALTVRFNKDLAATTTFRPSEGEQVDFATKLFLRVDKALLDQNPNCFISVTGICEKASRVEVARGQARSSTEGVQSVRLRALSHQGAFLEASLQFCTSIWQVKQTKTNNNRLSNFKSHLSQKQSSSEQKQSQPSKTPANFNHSEDLDKKEKSSQNSNKFSSVKASRSEKILPDQSVELESSAATTKESGKTEEHLNKSGDSEIVLSLQIKVDQLEERIARLSDQLKASTQKAREAELSLEQEKARTSQLQETKQQLAEMLILEEQKNNISMKHIEKLTKLIESLGNPESDFELIEEKDEIIMLNEELENELTNKNITINQMRNEIEQLKQRIAVLETAKMKTVSTAEAHSTQKPIVASSKQIDSEKAKIDKRASEKNLHTPKKSEEETATNRVRDAKKLRQKDTDKKELKTELASNTKKPGVPKNPREVKSPATLKADPSSNRAVKGKPGKTLKIQQKTTIQTDKRSQMQSSLGSMAQLDMLSEPNNLMINSRSNEMQLSKLKPS